MNKHLIFLFCLFIPLFCMAQNPLPRYYDYDAAGNRETRYVIPMLLAPQDSLQVDERTSGELQITNDEYFVEKIAQVEIKIYPNPATEKITLEITNLQDLQTGVFKLYNLNGQLLKECPVHSVSTEVSLAGLSAGVYLLKVNINGRVEEWKIIKQ